MSDQYFKHQELVKEFKLKATREIPEMRVFDRHVGLFYAKRHSGGVVNYTPVKINSPGMSDAYALISRAYNKGIVHIEIEFKTGNAKQNSDQVNWQNFITNMGGLYLIVRNADQGVSDIKRYLSGLR